MNDEKVWHDFAKDAMKFTGVGCGSIAAEHADIMLAEQRKRFPISDSGCPCGSVCEKCSLKVALKADPALIETLE